MEHLTACMDLNLPQVPKGFRQAVEDLCNREINADRRIDVRVVPRDETFALPDVIRTATNLVPLVVKDVRSSTSSGSTRRPTAARTWLRPARSAASRWSRSRTRARAFAACASGSPVKTPV